MDCSIIIPHYNQVNYLKACLSALAADVSDHRYEVIIIDAMHPASHELKQSIVGDHIRWISTDVKNPYVSRNIGIRNAQSDNIILLDAKCSPQRGFINSAVKALRQYKIVTGPYVVMPRSDKIKDLIYGIFYLHTERNISKDYGVTCGNLGCKKTLFEKIGPFDESRISGRDIAWTRKALSEGYEIKYVPGMAVNYAGQTWTEFCESIQKYMRGVASYQKEQGWSVKMMLMYGLKMLFPMRQSTYEDALARREISLSRKGKWYLWLWVWRAKANMAYHYMKSMLKDG